MSPQFLLSLKIYVACYFILPLTVCGTNLFLLLFFLIGKKTDLIFLFNVVILISDDSLKKGNHGYVVKNIYIIICNRARLFIYCSTKGKKHNFCFLFSVSSIIVWATNFPLEQDMHWFSKCIIFKCALGSSVVDRSKAPIFFSRLLASHH